VIRVSFGQVLLVLLIGGAIPPIWTRCAQLMGRKDTSAPSAGIAQAENAGPGVAAPNVKQVGNASWYGAAQNGKETASGDIFDPNALTAAHRTLPLGSKAVVTNLATGKAVNVTINDRGPYAKGRKIDLSRAAAKKIGISKEGVTKVKIEARPSQKPPEDVGP